LAVSGYGPGIFISSQLVARLTVVETSAHRPICPARARPLDGLGWQARLLGQQSRSSGCLPSLASDRAGQRGHGVVGCAETSSCWRPLGRLPWLDTLPRTDLQSPRQRAPGGGAGGRIPPRAGLLPPDAYPLRRRVVQQWHPLAACSASRRAALASSTVSLALPKARKASHTVARTAMVLSAVRIVPASTMPDIVPRFESHLDKRRVTDADLLIRRLRRAHPLPAHSTADLPKRYSLMRSRRQR